MSIRKKIFTSLLTVLLVLVLWQWELLAYGARQGKGQLRILRNAIPLKEVMADSTFPDSLKARLAIIQEARLFARNELGLTKSDNYTTFYDQKGQVALWNVTACAPYSFEAKTWWFPFVGEVPYKGFFEKERAVDLYNELAEAEYDVRVSPVAGWSTLGWFNDPILSSMLDRSPGSLAELIIHELTHGTVFVKGEVTYNENLASFIGEQGAVLFLKHKYGEESPELQEYLGGEVDGDKFTAYILAGSHKLDSLYQTFSTSQDQESKEQAKQLMIDRICSNLDTVSFTSDRYADIFKKKRPNNAYFMSFMRYYSNGDSLKLELTRDYGGDLPAFIAEVKRKFGKP